MARLAVDGALLVTDAELAPDGAVILEGTLTDDGALLVELDQEDPMATLTPTTGIGRTQAPYGLLSVATDRTGEPPRWADGVAWPTLATGGTGTQGQCAPRDAIETDDGWSSALGFVVRAAYSCGYDVEENTTGATTRLAALGPAAVEEQVWAGVANVPGEVGEPFLTQGATDLSGGTPLDPVVAVGLLDQWLDSTYGSLGVLHMTRRSADVLVAASALTERGGRLYTRAGTPVAAGVGYTGQPSSTWPVPPASAQWVFATPAVVYWHDDVLTRPWVDLGANEVGVEAEQRWIVGWDGGAAAVAGTLVSLENA